MAKRVVYEFLADQQHVELQPFCPRDKHPTAALPFSADAYGFLTPFKVPSYLNNLEVSLIDAKGQVLLTRQNVQPAVPCVLPLDAVAPGVYWLRLTGNSAHSVQRLVIAR